jgi:energy-coupling factor transporter ATP-binding protein EcfA2
MSYQVLARKWRPASFDALVGQEHVLQALRHALDSGRLHHAYLFTGTRGVGKTTIARIVARCLNCEQGVSSTPCGECSACREIERGAQRRPDRGRCGLADQGRGHAGTARQRAVRADPLALQGVPHRRGAHALRAFVQRPAEDARGAAGTRQVPARDHRSAEAAGDGAVALPAVQPEEPVCRTRRRHLSARAERGRRRRRRREPCGFSGARRPAACAMPCLTDQAIAFGNGRLRRGRSRVDARHRRPGPRLHAARCAEGWCRRCAAGCLRGDG